jgi:anti-anti-sigma factor
VLTGDIDLTGRDAIGPQLIDAAAAATGPLVVDLTGVRYLSSAGVALLAEAAGRAGSALSLVVAEGSPPARVLELTGLAGALPVEVRSRTAAPDPGTP